MPSVVVKRRASMDPAESPAPDSGDAATTAAPSTSTDNSSASSKSKNKKPHRIYPHDVQYPFISATTIKALKWGDSRELIAPFLNEDEKASIHKLTRSQLSELVDARVLSGDVTPAQFWAVVGTDKIEREKTRYREKKRCSNGPLDPIVAEALKKTNVQLNNNMGSSPVDARASLPPPPPQSVAMATPSSSFPYPKPSIPYLSGMPPLAGTTTTGTTTTAPTVHQKPSAPAPGAGAGGTLMRPPMMPLPRPQYKYTLRATFATGSSSIGDSSSIPPGIVIGEPIPPNPFTPPSITGMFYSSALLAFDGKVIQPGKAMPQAEYLYNTLIIMLSQVNATLADIVTMTVSVANIESNGKDVLAIHEKYMRAKGGAPCAPCAYSMVGVSGFLHKGCVVQVQVTAMVRRGLMANILLDSSGSGGPSCWRPHPLAVAPPPSAATTSPMQQAPPPPKTASPMKQQVLTRKLAHPPSAVTSLMKQHLPTTKASPKKAAAGTRTKVLATKAASKAAKAAATTTGRARGRPRKK